MKTLVKAVYYLSACAIAAVSLYAMFDPAIQSPVFKRLLRVIPWAGFCHIVFGSLALILGGLQLSVRLRQRSLQLHKLIGNCYVGCVLIAAVGAMVSLSFTQSPWSSRSGFWLLAIVWPIVTLAGYPRGGKFNFQWHGKLMLYSYALTCSAITLRIYLGIMLGLGINFSVAYPIAGWAGFLGNVLIAYLVLDGLSKRRTIKASTVS